MKATFLLMFLLNITPSFAQEIKNTSHPNISILSENGKVDQRIYHLPCESIYKITRQADGVELLAGSGVEVNISGLVPGVYFIYYTNLKGQDVLDRFSIDRH